MKISGTFFDIENNHELQPLKAQVNIEQFYSLNEFMKPLQFFFYPPPPTNDVNGDLPYSTGHLHTWHKACAHYTHHQ